MFSAQVAKSGHLVYQQHGMASQPCKRKSKNDFKSDSRHIFSRKQWFLKYQTEASDKLVVEPTGLI